MKYEALLDLTVVQALYCYKRGWIYITLLKVLLLGRSMINGGSNDIISGWKGPWLQVEERSQLRKLHIIYS